MSSALALSGLAKLKRTKRARRDLNFFARCHRQSDLLTELLKTLGLFLILLRGGIGESALHFSQNFLFGISDGGSIPHNLSF
jgi:hypothetical protein